MNKKRDDDESRLFDAAGFLSDDLKSELSDLSSASVLEDIAAPRETSNSSIERHIWRWFDFLILFLIFFAALISVVSTQNGVGLSWDEAYYYEPSLNSLNWLSHKMFSVELNSAEDNINSVWDEIWELPSVVKFINGLSFAFFNAYFDDLKAMRMGSALAFALMLIFIYMWCFEEIGRLPSLFSVLSLALMPKIFGHAHIAATETISSLIFLITLILFRKGLSSLFFSILFGICFGIALATKINAFFLPVVFIIYAFIYNRKKSYRNFYSMIFISPAVMLLIWPWLWGDPFVKLIKYINFYLNHQYTALFYFGKKYNYGNILAPISYPMTLTLLSIPALFLPFIFAGILKVFFKIRTFDFGFFVLWAALAQLGIASLPRSPKYDDVRLFIHIFPYIAILSGIGFGAILNIIPSPTKIKGAASYRTIISIIFIIFFMIYGCYNITKIHPYELSYFNELIGGISGADEKGMEITYWGEAVNEQVAKDINELIPDGAKVMPLALHGKVFGLMQDWGMIKKGIIFGGDPPYDYHILLNRKGFFMRPEWCLYQRWKPLKVYSISDVPILMIYKTGEEFEKEWQQQIIPSY